MDDFCLLIPSTKLNHRTIIACTTCRLSVFVSHRPRVMRRNEKDRRMWPHALRWLCWMSKISNEWNKMIQRHRQHIDSAVSHTQTGKTKGAPDMYFLKVTQHVILFWSKLIHCSLARSVYLPHAFTEAPAFFSVCPIVTDKNARAVLPHLARLPFPASLRSLSSSTPSLLLYFLFFCQCLSFVLSLGVTTSA